jgi:hypothetical protein
MASAFEHLDSAAIDQFPVRWLHGYSQVVRFRIETWVYKVFLLLRLQILQLMASPSMVNHSHLGSVLLKTEGISEMYDNLEMNASHYIHKTPLKKPQKLYTQESPQSNKRKNIVVIYHLLAKIYICYNIIMVCHNLSC